MATIDKIVFSQNTPDKKNTLWARPSEKGTELLIFNKGKWGTVGADDFQRFHYEVYSSLEDITEPKPNALYLIGPKGEGEDKYDEYVYTEEGFTKIGDTSIDMSDVIKYSKNSDNSYTLKAEGTEIKKLKTTDDSTIVLGNNNSIEFGASGTINMQSGNISGVKDIQMTFGKIDNVGTISGSSGGLDITASGTAGVNINGITIKSGGTLTFGDGTTMNTAPGTTDYNDLINKPTKVSQFENDANYLTQHQDISGKEDKMPVLNILSGSTSVSCLMGTYYTFEDEINTMNIILPTTQELEPTIQTTVFFMTIGTTPAITFNSTLPIYYHDGFGLEAGKTYEVNALFNGSAWVVTAVEIFVPEPEPITIVYKGDNASATNIMTKTIDVFGDTYTLDEASITKMTLDDNKVTLTDFNIANLGQYGGTCDVYTYTFNDANEHTLKVWTNSSDMFRLSPWSGGPSPSQSAYFSSIKSVVIPNTITTIGAKAFGYCSGLTSITIPSGVTSIGNAAFQNCTSLTSVTIGSGVTRIGDSAFRLCSSLTSIDISDSVTSIGNAAFDRCSGLTSITIGSGVTSIGEYAFRECSGLTSIDIPDSVTSIGNAAFDRCSGLTSITIGSGVTRIGDSAFRECSGLTSVTSNATTAPTIQSNTFQNVKTGGTLRVPSGSSGYDVWMGTGSYYLGKYNWTKVEQ